MGGVVEVRASHGNTRLGGDDFDRLLAQDLARQFQERHGINLQDNRRAWARLLHAAEAAKIDLSSRPFAWIKEEYLAEKESVPLHLEHEVSRNDLVDTLRDLLDQTLDSIDRVIEDAEIEPKEINQVLLVGGSTRIPAVWEQVADYLDMEPQMSINPEEAVALGAGVQAAIIAGQPIDAILVDVTPHSLGIAVAEQRLGRIITDRYNTLIHRNTTIPVSKEEVYSTLFPDQEAIKIEVYQGESPVASENALLGDFLITDLEPEQPGELAQVTVKFDFDMDGILKVTARDRRTGKQENIIVEASPTRLSETEILKATSRLAETAPAAAELPAEARVMLERAERLLAKDQLDPDSRAEMQDLLAGVRNTYAAGELSHAEELLEELLDLLFDWEE
jgi:molecular chaperone DnaK